MDFNGSFLARVRDHVGANPIILVVTKVASVASFCFLECVCIALECFKSSYELLSVMVRSIFFQRELI